jgi:hypothetical protein
MEGKIPSEQTTRQQLMKYAKLIGAQEDLKQLFKKWDTIIPLASPGERVSMAHMAIMEIERMLDIYSAQHDGLTINGKIVIPAAEKKELA